MDEIVFSMLQAPDPLVDFKRVLQKKLPGTTSWLLNSAVFQAWLQTVCGSLLWIAGFPGCGKTVLASAIIQATKQHCEENANTALGYFFFKFDDEAKNNVDGMLRSLIVQLAEQDISTLNLVRQSLNSTARSPCIDDELLDLLYLAIGNYDRTYIILDGLDDIPADELRSAVLQVLATLRKTCPAIHLLVTRRSGAVDIKEGLSALDGDILRIETRDIQKDITNRIFDHIFKHAGGSFRWVECQTRDLSSSPVSEDMLCQHLSIFPKDVCDSYERILDRVTLVNRKYVKSMLIMLCSTLRPLTAEQLLDGIAVNLEHYPPEYDPNLRFEGGVQDLLRMCPGLIEAKQDPEMGSEIVQLAHISIKEYLQSDQISPTVWYSMYDPMIHYQMAGINLAILLNPAFQSQADKLASDGDVPERKNLASYAAGYWSIHYNKGWNRLVTNDQVSCLFNDEKAFGAWIRQCQTVPKMGDLEGDKPSLLYVAALLGLEDMANRLLRQEGLDVNAFGGTYGTALGAASGMGHANMVDLLVKHGAEIQPPASRYRWFLPLQWAVGEGREVVVRSLLNYGARDPSGVSVFLAATSGSSHILRMLVHRDHEVVDMLSLPQPNGCSETVELLDAVCREVKGDKLPMILRILFLHGGDAKQGRPLLYPCVLGNTEAVRILIEGDANVNVVDDQGSSPLILASKNGHSGIVQLLIEKQADPKVANENGRTAFAMATLGGHNDIAEMLLATYLDINAEDSEGCTPLGLVCSLNNLFLLKRLLANPNVDVNATDRRGWTPLVHSILCGKYEAVKLLLSREGISVSMVDNRGFTPIYWARSTNQTAIVELLEAAEAEDAGQERMNLT